MVPAEAEHVILNADATWPQQIGDDKLVVWGPTEEVRLLQVIFVLKRPEELPFEALSIDQWADVDEEDRIIYVIHAMDLTDGMKRKYRKRRR